MTLMPIGRQVLQDGGNAVDAAVATAAAVPIKSETSLVDPKAAVAFEAKKPLEIVEVDLDGPRAGEALVEKKSTTMLPRLIWHQGMNSAMAAPVATPVNSKSPTMVSPVVLRPIKL